MNEFEWIAVAVILTLSTARITRLLVIDDFPPIKFLRDRYEKLTDGTGWYELSYCPYCAAPWVAIALVLWGYFTDWQAAWWIANGIAAASYPASILVDKDGTD